MAATPEKGLRPICISPPESIIGHANEKGLLAGSLPGSGATSFVESVRTACEANDQADQLDSDSRPTKLSAQFLRVAPILVGVFITGMDNTIVVASYGAIGSYFAELQKTSWIATAYLLTVTSFQPLSGKFSDIFGRKSCLLSAYIIFAIGCALCGSARNMNMLIACRALAGIGGGTMAALASITISDLVPLRSRGTWQGLMNIVWACGNIAGSSLGGYLADTIGWRWGFFIQLPLVFISILSVYFFLRMPQPTPPPTPTPKSDDSTPKSDDASPKSSPSPPPPTFKSKLQRLDFLGALTLILAVFLLLFSLDRGTTLGWTSPLTLSTLLASLLLLFPLFLLIEARIAAEPFIPPRLLLPRALAPSYLTNFFSVATSYGQLFRMSLFFQAVLGKSAAATGAWFVVGIVADLLGSLVVGVVVQGTGRYYWASCVSYGVMLAGVLTVSAGAGMFGTGGSLGVIIAGLAITALGYEGGITTSLVSLIANVDPRDQAVATAVTYFFRSLGSVLGLSIGTTLSQSTLLTTLQKTLVANQTTSQLGDAAEITKHVRESLSYLTKLDPVTREIVREAYRKATQSALIFAACLAFGALVVSGFVVERRLVR